MAFARATRGGQISRYENFSQFMREDGGDPGHGKVESPIPACAALDENGRN